MATHTAQQALRKARQAFTEGYKHQARMWALRAAQEDPEWDESWLFLAEMSSPKASLVYLKKALELNPTNLQAREKMSWAVKRWREQEQVEKTRKPVFSIPESADIFTENKPALLPWTLTFLILAAVLFAWLYTPQFSSALTLTDTPAAVSPRYQKATLTATATATNTLTPTPSATPTVTPTYTPSMTPTPSLTPTPTPIPSATPLGYISKLPSGVKANERWFDLNLSQQRLYAYEGKTLVNSFLVSTGTWLHPTVTGRYRIYVKYRYAHMSGPGYFLPNVPYTMYFYQGYGIHGTYWHNNFGTPMSHGCVNLRTSDAKWAYHWASVGTLVIIHY